jgi:hypothetical protein
MLIAHHNLEKDSLQIKSIEHLLQSVDWWNNYQAHKVREKIYNMQIDNLNISLQENPNPDIYKRQVFAKYLFLDKDLHDDLEKKDSLNNLRKKAEDNQTIHLNLEKDIVGNSKFIINYELVTILLIVAASLAGISEIAKNKLLAYSAFCIGGIGCVLLILTLSAGMTLPLQASEHEINKDAKAEQETRQQKESIFENSSISNSSSAVDLNEMYDYCTKYQKLITKTCDALFPEYK